MRRIQIAEVTPALFGGGVEERVARIVRGLDRSRFEITWVGFCDVNPNLIARAGGQIDVVSAPKTRNTGVDYGLIALLAQVFSRKRIDLVHVHNWSTSIYGIAAARLAGVPHVLYGVGGRDSPEGTQPKRRAIMRVLAPLVSAFTTVADFLADEMAVDWDVARRAIRVIRTGVDLDQYVGGASRAEARRRLELPEDAIVIGTVSVMRPVKRLEDFITAGARAARDNPRIHLVAIGGTAEEQLEPLRRMGDAVGLGPRLHVYRRVEDPHNVLKAFDAYVNCSVFEGASNAIIEAMASGLPIIATAVGGTPELVTLESNGLLVEPCDIGGLTAAFTRIARDEQLRRSLAQGSLARATKRHDQRQMVAEYHRLYEQVLETNEPSKAQLGLRSLRAALASATSLR